jgi:4'-phosphopantetheinyl transferase EntD
MKYNGLGIDFEDTLAERRIKEIDSMIGEMRKERDRLKSDLHCANAKADFCERSAAE